MRKELTPQQAAILKYARQGYCAPEIAAIVGCHPSLPSDQLDFIRNKGYEVSIKRASRGRLPLPQRVREESA